MAQWVLKSEEAVLRQLQHFKELIEQKGTLNEQQWAEIERRREAYLTGEIKSSSWKEVRERLSEKHGL